MNPVFASAADVGQAFSDFVAAIGKEGSFALGTLLGCGISYAAHKLASRDNEARLKIDLEREKELYRQLKAKDERINTLHGKIGELQGKLNNKLGV